MAATSTQVILLKNDQIPLLEDEENLDHSQSSAETESSKTSISSGSSSSDVSRSSPNSKCGSHLTLTVMGITALYHLLHSLKTPYNTSLMTGSTYITELLEGNDRRFLDMMRMNKDVFLKLCREIANTGIEPSSRMLPLEEQVGIFMYIVGHCASN